MERERERDKQGKNLNEIQIVTFLKQNLSAYNYIKRFILPYNMRLNVLIYICFLVFQLKKKISLKKT